MVTLIRERPSLIFVQNPSMVLAALVSHYGRVVGVPVVVDAHNAGVFPMEGASRLANVLTRRIARAASLTVVTNAGLARAVRQQGGVPAVLPDPIPDFIPPASSHSLGGQFNVLFICTWARDEPYLEVLRAAESVRYGTRIYITGNSKGRELAFGRPLPENVELTGFVDEEEFVRLLFTADLVMDLTTRSDCLVCGAYEAVAAGTPMLLSQTAALQDYFDRGSLFTDNGAEDIAAKLDKARLRHSELQGEMPAAKTTLRLRWGRHLEGVEEALKFLESGAEEISRGTG